MSSTRNDAGFTLVEVLVALSILSLLLTGLGSSLYYARYILALSDDNARRLEDIATLRKVMFEWVSQINAVGEARNTAIFGNSHGITVISIPPQIFAEAVPLEMTLAPDQANHGLIASWGKDHAAAPRIRRLLPETYNATFSFFSPTLGWTESWNNRDALPTLLRVQIRGKGDGFDAALIVPVRSARGASCVAPPSLTACAEQR